MYFIQLISAALALPALSVATILPRLTECKNYSHLAVGQLFINTEETSVQADAVRVQIKKAGSSDDNWADVAKIPSKSAGSVDVAARHGVYNLRVCGDLGRDLACTYPAGQDMIWNFRRDGDRWPFTLFVSDDVQYGRVKTYCVVAEDAQMPFISVAPTVTSTTSIRTTTSQKASSTTRVSTTRSTSFTTSTRTRTTTTQSNARTSSSSRATTTTTRRN